MTRVAIACQGGGSHTAFTAGVLCGVLDERPPDVDVVALSGTSGGAINAVLAWSGLRDGDDSLAIERVRGFWRDVSARAPVERAANLWTQWVGRSMEAFGSVELSPYGNPTSRFAERRLAGTIRRHAGDVEEAPGTPRLYVGAVDVESGEFTVFEDGEGGVEAILASAALPALFPAVEVDGRSYWDGLFSQNPPIRHFTSTPVEEKPEEIWVVRIDPAGRADVPTTMAEITDRRNELAGNLSLDQEEHAIETINRLIEEGALVDDRYRHIEIREVTLDLDLDATSKLDRDPAFIDRLMRRGERAAPDFWT